MIQAEPDVARVAHSRVPLAPPPITVAFHPCSARSPARFFHSNSLLATSFEHRRRILKCTTARASSSAFEALSSPRRVSSASSLHDSPSQPAPDLNTRTGGRRAAHRLLLPVAHGAANDAALAGDVRAAPDAVGPEPLQGRAQVGRRPLLANSPCPALSTRSRLPDAQTPLALPAPASALWPLTEYDAEVA
eukprot:1738687-Pleurochrysis_carterae.AAC.1